MTRPTIGGRYHRAAHAAFIEGAIRQDPNSIAAVVDALASLREAVNLNPLYGRGLNELAYTKVLEAVLGLTDIGAALGEADALSQQALDLDGDHDYTAHWSRAFYHQKIGEYAQCLQSFADAERLFKSHTDPMDRRSGLMMEYAEALADARLFGGVQQTQDYKGDTVDVIAKAKEAIHKAMTPPDWYYWIAAYVHYADGDLNEALSQLDSMAEQPGALIDSLLLRAQILQEQGNTAEADQVLAQWAQLKGDQQQAEEQALTAVPPEVLNTLNIVPSAAQGLAAAVIGAELRELSKLGQAPPEPTDAALQWRQALREVLEKNTGVLEEKGINLDLRPPSSD